MNKDIRDAKWARHQLGNAIRRGRIKRPARCEKCGEEDVPLKDGRTSIQAHHHKGYDHPLDVQWLCVMCHRHITPHPYGESCGSAKATWGLVTEIRARYDAGERYYQIAREVGLDPTAVHRIVTHRSWPESKRPSAKEKRYA